MGEQKIPTYLIDCRIADLKLDSLNKPDYKQQCGFFCYCDGDYICHAPLIRATEFYDTSEIIRAQEYARKRGVEMVPVCLNISTSVVSDFDSKIREQALNKLSDAEKYVLGLEEIKE